MDPTEGGILDWASAARPMPGESDSGDLALVVPLAERVLVAVIDGAGHGPAAARASQAAARQLAEHPDGSLERLVARCHEALRGTRGAVMTLALVLVARLRGR